ncbi:hypothetical protein MHB44_01705 [Lysinibacillus sp. FSL H8-0500]|uniref:hypothetical protein n=1 Tax=Lysinibacillus sp. FSL H8-0500 TaxID=2921393 RepID=UPI003100D0E9
MLNEQSPNIPWRQLTTAYGRGTAIPQLIEQEQYQQLAGLIEHQGTLWQVTPWTLLLLLKQLASKNAKDVTLQEIELYLAVAYAITKDSIDRVQTVPTMQELLDIQYLWSENEEEDELEWEEDTPKGYEQRAFLGYYYFSHLLLQEAIPIFMAITTDHKETADSLTELLALLSQRSRWETRFELNPE